MHTGYTFKNTYKITNKLDPRFKTRKLKYAVAVDGNVILWDGVSSVLRGSGLTGRAS